MAEPLATIVVVPREQFSRARECLRSIYASTEPLVPLIYVDGNSPRPLARHLEAEAASGRLALVRRDHYLTGNEARNLALQHVRTRYVAFVDNDVLVRPGWLDALVRCAEETGAWIVGPLYCIGDPQSLEVHTAGAKLSLIEAGGRRYLREEHEYCGQPLRQVQERVRRSPYDEVEFHCLLARTSMFDRLGMLDEGLLSFFDHTDFCLGVRQSGGAIYTESDAVVTYLPPGPFLWAGLPYFLLRWSKTWYEKSLEHFCAKWGLQPNDPVFLNHLNYLRWQRSRLPTQFPGVNRRLDRVVGGLLEWTVVRQLEQHRRQCRTSPTMVEEFSREGR